jgi:hypothetical protein
VGEREEAPDAAARVHLRAARGHVRTLVTMETQPDLERDTPMTRIYVCVLIVEAAIIVALWMFGSLFF